MATGNASDSDDEPDRCVVCGVDPTRKSSNLTKRTLLTNVTKEHRCGHRFCQACVGRGVEAKGAQFACPDRAASSSVLASILQEDDASIWPSPRSILQVRLGDTRSLRREPSGFGDTGSGLGVSQVPVVVSNLRPPLSATRVRASKARPRSSDASKSLRLFESPLRRCPVEGCEATVRRATLDPRPLDEVEVSRDAAARRRVMAVYNRDPSSFDTRRAYDDYLEAVETTVHARARAAGESRRGRGRDVDITWPGRPDRASCLRPLFAW